MACLIIFGGAESACDDHEGRMANRLGQCLGNAFKIIPDGGDPGHRKAGCSQFSRGIPGVDVSHPA